MPVLNFPNRLNKSQVVATMRLRLLELEKLKQHPDPELRKHARREIQEINERLLEYEHSKLCEAAICCNVTIYDAAS